MLFLVNAGGTMARKRRKHRGGSKRRRATRVRAVHHRRSGGRKRKRAMPAALKAYWAAKRGGRTNPVARRKRHRGGHRRRSYRRNPGISLGGGGFVRTLTRGAKCGAFVTLGEGLSVAIPGLVKLPVTGFLGLGVRALVGTAVAVFGKGIFGAENAAYVVAGAFGGIYRTLVRQFNIPILGPALAGYPGPIQMRSYAADAAAKGMIAPAGLRTGTTPEQVASGMLF
jgi:hypothetical protein